MSGVQPRWVCGVHHHQQRRPKAGVPIETYCFSEKSRRRSRMLTKLLGVVAGVELFLWVFFV